jgi:F-type H+-transporting ATPase subunit delta
MPASFRGASAEALAALSDDLTAGIDGGADAARVADDLFAVAAVLSSEPSLRRVLTDLSAPAEAKAGLVRTVLGDKVAAESLALLEKAVGRRWAATRDLGDALEHLGVLALVQGADRSGQADALESELFAFERLVADNPDLRDALSDPARSVADRRSLVRSLLQDKATPATVRLAEQAVAGSHRTVSVALEDYQKVAAEHRSQLVGTVRVARELSGDELGRLQTALSEQYSRPVHLNVLVDPSVIGGVRVEVGYDVIDGTVASKLDEARRRLAGTAH